LEDASALPFDFEGALGKTLELRTMEGCVIIWLQRATHL
jgi:hypothetical protein